MNASSGTTDGRHERGGETASLTKCSSQIKTESFKPDIYYTHQQG